MNAKEWRKQRDDRTLRYPGVVRTLASGPRISIAGDPKYLSSYAGQVAVITAANLVGRMSPSILRVCIPNIPMVSPLPWVGTNLREYIMEGLVRADPYGNFEEASKPAENDYVLFFGPEGSGKQSIHGAGWESFIGTGGSPIEVPLDCNPVGAALAATVAVSEMFCMWFSSTNRSIYLNAYSWESERTHSNGLLVPDKLPVGSIWTVGTGSVGTAILYFLTLCTRTFTARLFDMDQVKIHNLDRSPLFLAAHVNRFKAEVTGEYLKSVGLSNVDYETVGLDESTTWRERLSGTPDILVSAANERNVRYVIEANYPPLQIYGTTGNNWQAAVLRHFPTKEPCSCCFFPPENFVPTQCSTSKVSIPDVGHVDAAVPFLSFSAGIMAVAEILKFACDGFSEAPNRVVLNLKPQPRFVPVSFHSRKGCVCECRSKTVHEKLLMGGRYSHMYDYGSAVGF